MYDSPIRGAVVEVTNACNLRCAHCASGSGRPREGELSTGEMLGVLDDLASLGCEEVTLLGGEIFLRHDWATLARRIVDRGMRLCIATNGVAVDDHVLRTLVSVRPDVVGVSLDGATAETYKAVRGVDAFARVTALIDRLRAAGIENVTAITTFSQQNIGEFDLFVERFDGTPVNWQVQVAGCAGPRMNRDHFLTRAQYASLVRKVFALLKDRRETLKLCPMDDIGYFPIDPTSGRVFDWFGGCEAGRSIVGIRANGDLLGCLSLGDEFVVGNLRTLSLRQAWRESSLFDTFRRKGESLEGACRVCPEAERCRAGCSDIAQAAGGSMYDNPYCLRRIEGDDILGAMGL